MFALGGVCVCGSQSVVVCALPLLPLPYTCPTAPTADVAAAVTALHTSCPALAPTLGHVPYRPRSWCCRCCCSYSHADVSPAAAIAASRMCAPTPAADAAAAAAAAVAAVALWLLLVLLLLLLDTWTVTCKSVFYT
ncbi:hypothetical protein PILCRDRAFT_1785 [Piloderma croceum F 1598]|uniref:Uncharacterized protein n=1 Tax=Piloderma croceum (strain F 1598) TaxID=765440 RepID=A0A0C3G2B1_PILCF|nr:hypothetical protein PILCRDRAFT_1785 [Piloderma croceum F 1598]